MTPVTVFKGQSVAVFGLGGSGFVTAQALVAGGARVNVWDDNEHAREKARAAGLRIENLASADWTSFSALILAPGVPLTHPAPHWTVLKARAAGIEVIGDIELFCRERRKIAGEHIPIRLDQSDRQEYARAFELGAISDRPNEAIRSESAQASPFIAITGTNGKSTTTALVAHLFATFGFPVEIGGNIGTPILALNPPGESRVHVIECSSYQIDLAPSLDPSVGILLNVTPDHLDRHGTMENYAAIKARLVHAADLSVIGVDDAYTRAIAAELRAAGREVTAVSAAGQALADGIVFKGGRLLRREAGRSTLIADLSGIASLRGAHNGQNAAAAVAALGPLGLDHERVAQGLASFPGLAHRLEEVSRLGNVLFVNDSKATNADAAEKALLSFKNIFWILGGRAKAGGIEPLRPLFDRIAKGYLIGEASEAFARTIGDAFPVAFCETLEKAVPQAAAEAAKAAAEAAASALADPVVLLSPACASFDQFPDFEKRGDRFRDLAQALINEG